MDMVQTIEVLLEKYSHLFDLVKWLFIMFVALYTAQRVTLSKRSLVIANNKNRYDYFKELKDEFLNQELVHKRDRVCSFWIERMISRNSRWTGGVSHCRELAFAQGEDEIISIVRDSFGLDINIRVEALMNDENKAIVEETEEVLNVYEHLGKLVEAHIISEEDIKLFFYTMMGDTFVACLPYILYRRKSKPSYAHKIQAMLRFLPEISGDMGRV